MDNLKPCPFCGGEPKLMQAWVECKKCRAMAAVSGARNDAISAWNRRFGSDIDVGGTEDGWISVDDRLPESGKHVLLCCEVRPAMKRYICDGYYAKAKSIINSCSFDYECAVEYDEEQDEYFLLEGFYEVIKNWDEYISITIEDFVTHWMPLPAPPEGGKS